MEVINTTRIIQFNDNQLHNVRKAVGYEDVKKLKQDIELLKDWIRMQNHFTVKEFDEGYLERLLIYNKGSIERTKQKFDKLCTYTNLLPEFLQNFNIKNEFRALFTMSNVCVLPKPTEDNYRVLVTNITGEDDKDFQLVDYYRYLMVLGHYMMCNDYCLGYELIADLRNVTMFGVTKLNPVIVHKGMLLMVEAMGQRIRKIHLLSSSKFFEIVLTLFKQGLSAKLKQRLMVHESVEGLHKHFSKEQLPKDYDGEEKCIKELCEMDFNEFSSDNHIARVKFMETIATNENCRLPCHFNEEYSGMPGSFKTLCVD